MKRATLRDLRYRFKEVEAQLAEGEEIEIVRRNKPIAVLMPVKPKAPVEVPDFLARMRQIWGDTSFEKTGAELIAEGIEERDELEVLLDAGVMYGQGWLWGKPN